CPPPPTSTLFPYTTLFRSRVRTGGTVAKKLYEDDVLVIGLGRFGGAAAIELQRLGHNVVAVERDANLAEGFLGKVSKLVQADARSEEHTSELQSRFDLVCR